jgi:hypothetical protein
LLPFDALADPSNKRRNTEMQVARPISGRILGFKVKIEYLIEID